MTPPPSSLMCQLSQEKPYFTWFNTDCSQFQCEKTSLPDTFLHFGHLSGEECLSKEVKFSNLKECQTLSYIYLCHHHGILDKLAWDYGIGDLYPQKHNAAIPLCPMEVVELAESVLPLSRNCFVILNNAIGFIGQMVSAPSFPLQEESTKQCLSLIAPSISIFSNSSVYMKMDYHHYK